MEDDYLPTSSIFPYFLLKFMFSLRAASQFYDPPSSADPTEMPLELSVLMK